jgi:hypothetical protein
MGVSGMLGFSMDANFIFPGFVSGLLGLLAVFVGLFGVLWPRTYQKRWFLEGAELLFVTVATILVVRVLAWSQNAEAELVGLGLPLGIIVGFQVVMSRFHAGPLRGGMAQRPWFLLSLGLCLGGWLTWRMEVWAKPNHGRLAVEELEQRLRQERFPAGAIQTSPADDRYNCHDWTFAGGPTQLLDHCTIEDYLRDHGYRLAEQPRVGDVVAYCSHFGEIMHTGVVKAMGKDGFVLIESKWGALGRYLHLPQVPGQFGKYVYYRLEQPEPHPYTASLPGSP